MVNLLEGATLAAMLLGFAATPAAAEEPSFFDSVKLEAIPDTHGVDPYPNELVLVRIRGVYRPQIKIQHLLQPSLMNFGWMHLTKDKTFETTYGNYSALGYERVIALFPEKPGPLTVDSFTHRLTVVDGEGTRDMEVRSAPVTINVAQWKGPGGPNDPNAWWLPASDVRVTDTWASDPNRVPRGETTRRTVMIEAYGVTAEQLPPPPVMRSPGVISFRGPTERETRVTENGPVARAIYNWDMRPTTAFPATVEAITIPWFDTKARVMREATIPPQRMAWAAEGAAGETAAAGPERPGPALSAGVGALAFALGLVILLGGSGAATTLPGLPSRALWRLRIAAWRRDPAAMRAAILELARQEPTRSRAWLSRTDVAGAIAELDRHLYHPGAGPPPNLRRLARAIVAARRDFAAAGRPSRSGLAPLDGPPRAASGG